MSAAPARSLPGLGGARGGRGRCPAPRARPDPPQGSRAPDAPSAVGLLRADPAANPGAGDRGPGSKANKRPLFKDPAPAQQPSRKPPGQSTRSPDTAPPPPTRTAQGARPSWRKARRNALETRSGVKLMRSHEAEQQFYAIGSRSTPADGAAGPPPTPRKSGRPRTSRLPPPLRFLNGPLLATRSMPAAFAAARR